MYELSFNILSLNKGVISFVCTIFTRMIPEIKNMPHSDRLLIGFFSLETEPLGLNLIQVFRIVNSIYNIGFDKKKP